MMYLLDSNTYIQAKNQYYGMDFCPAYWGWLDQQFQSGQLASIQMVAQELKSGNDDLAKWVKDRPEHFLPQDDEVTQVNFTEIVNHVAKQSFQPASLDSFLEKADPWLIAKAKALGATLVTHEALLNKHTRKVKIPNICKTFDVPCIDTFTLLRKLGARFIHSN